MVMSAFGFFRNMFSAPARAIEIETPSPSVPPAPGEPVCLLGDLHGRADLLSRFLTLRRRHFPSHRLISLGDAVDRGDDSAEVLRLLRAECAEGAICLRGNHEEMLLEFLDDPAGRGRRWLAYGGLETLASYGLRGIPTGATEYEAARDVLRERMGAETEAWIRKLPLIWQSRNLVAVHAALDPEVPPTLQEARSLVWGHQAFSRQPRTDGIWVAHGHTTVQRAHIRAGRIALDTSAYATGMLSYALIDPSMPEAERVTLGIVPAR